MRISFLGEFDKQKKRPKPVDDGGMLLVKDLAGGPGDSLVRVRPTASRTDYAVLAVDVLKNQSDLRMAGL